MTFTVLANVPSGHHPGAIQRRIPFASMLSPVLLSFSTIFNSHVYFTVGGNYRPIIANWTAVSSYERDDTNLGSEVTEDTRRTKREIEGTQQQ
jgi:hypothetical protein